MAAMTKADLELAQFLYDTYWSANRLADKLDSKRTGDHPVAIRLDGIAGHAKDAFSRLTGRSIFQVKSIIELSTISPADWTKLKYEERRDYTDG